MTDFDPPSDLIELRAAWLAAEAAHKRACREGNAGPEIKVEPQVPVYAVSPVERWVKKQEQRIPTDDQLERRQEAYDRLLGFTRKIAGHDWWATIPPGQKHAAESAVRRAAQALYDAEHATPVG